MRYPIATLNKALFDRLTAPLLAKKCRLYDAVPDGKCPPYAAMSKTTCSPWGSKTTSGYEVAAEVDFFSAYHGDKEIVVLIDTAINALLSTTLLLPDDWAVVIQSAEQGEINRAADDWREAKVMFHFKIFDARS